MDGVIEGWLVMVLWWLVGLWLLWLDFENGDVLILSFTMNCEVYCYYIVLVKCNLFGNSSGNLVSVDVKLPKH